MKANKLGPLLDFPITIIDFYEFERLREANRLVWTIDYVKEGYINSYSDMNLLQKGELGVIDGVRYIVDYTERKKEMEGVETLMVKKVTEEEWKEILSNQTEKNQLVGVEYSLPDIMIQGEVGRINGIRYVIN